MKRNYTQKRRHRLISNTYSISKCYCPVCGNSMAVPRIIQREKFHKKTMWCPVCKEKRIMTEVRSFDFYKNMLGEILN